VPRLRINPKITRMAPLSDRTFENVDARAGNRPRIVYMQCEEAQLEGEANAFFAFFALHDKLMSVHRRFNLDLPGLASHRYRSDIILTEYVVSDHRFHPCSERTLCTGEDPRVVSDGERAFVVCRGGLTEDADGAETYKIVALPAAVETRIVPPHGFKLGKNWQPFLKDGRLFAVQNFAPLTILELARDGRAEVVHQKPTQYWIPAPHDNFTMVRGGSNAVSIGDSLLGLGHLTIARNDHRPFFWVLDRSFDLSLIVPHSFLGLRARGFNIVDPTSLFHFRGRIYLGLSASEREWFYSQRFLNLLVDLPHFDFRSLTALEDNPVFADLGQHELHALPASRTFIPITMPHQVPSELGGGGVVSQGQSGCLLYGPYEPVDKVGTYVAMLLYACPGGSDMRAGHFEIGFFKDGNADTAVGTKLRGTDGRPETATLTFTTNGRVGSLLETRVLVAQGVNLNALSIRVIEVAGT
jgi:hypothetical protein